MDDSSRRIPTCLPVLKTMRTRHIKLLFAVFVGCMFIAWIVIGLWPNRMYCEQIDGAFVMYRTSYFQIYAKDTGGSLLLSHAISALKIATPIAIWLWLYVLAVRAKRRLQRGC